MLCVCSEVIQYTNKYNGPTFQCFQFESYSCEISSTNNFRKWKPPDKHNPRATVCQHQQEQCEHQQEPPRGDQGQQTKGQCHIPNT